ncbi:hypothetical protein Glove_79g106 [Diversispora epigaea]|uniref:Uncharacterized protein n=1 Tax=Diversispora epigaea TaxID=1348612 RepID=A0A397JF77_9GLOM|nr:hypothetical protein Glove_79g106 [Diversispora epigaea]
MQSSSNQIPTQNDNKKQQSIQECLCINISVTCPPINTKIPITDEILNSLCIFQALIKDINDSSSGRLSSSSIKRICEQRFPINLNFGGDSIRLGINNLNQHGLFHLDPHHSRLAMKLKSNVYICCASDYRLKLVKVKGEFKKDLHIILVNLTYHCDAPRMIFISQPCCHCDVPRKISISQLDQDIYFTIASMHACYHCDVPHKISISQPCYHCDVPYFCSRVEKVLTITQEAPDYSDDDCGVFSEGDEEFDKSDAGTNFKNNVTSRNASPINSFALNIVSRQNTTSNLNEVVNEIDSNEFEEDYGICEEYGNENTDED